MADVKIRMAATLQTKDRRARDAAHAAERWDAATLLCHDNTARTFNHLIRERKIESAQ
jgi:hypothetical protein